RLQLRLDISCAQDCGCLLPFVNDSPLTCRFRPSAAPESCSCNHSISRGCIQNALTRDQLSSEIFSTNNSSRKALTSASVTIYQTLGFGNSGSPSRFKARRTNAGVNVTGLGMKHSAPSSYASGMKSSKHTLPDMMTTK